MAFTGLLKLLLESFFQIVCPFELRGENRESGGNHQKSWPRQHDHGDSSEEDDSAGEPDESFFCSDLHFAII